MNRRFLRPNIVTTKDPNKYNEYLIEEILSVRVQDFEEEEAVDLSIAKMTLDEITDYAFYLTVVFSEPSHVSRDITDLDLLEVRFIEPRALIDALNWWTLEPDKAFDDSAEIPPQLTEAEYRELQQLADTSSKVSLAVSIFEIVACFVAQKALQSMFILILTL